MANNIIDKESVNSAELSSGGSVNGVYKNVNDKTLKYFLVEKDKATAEFKKFADKYPYALEIVWSNDKGYKVNVNLDALVKFAGIDIDIV